MSIECPALDGFYLRANGGFVCWNSPGSMHPITILNADELEGVDIVRDVMNGEKYRRMRRELLAHRNPFDYCSSCGWGSRKADDRPSGIDPENFELRAIKTLQIEPSFLCNLDCPQCVPIGQRKLGKPPYSLDPRLLRKLVDDLSRHEIQVGSIQYGGFGEPLMTPEFPAMARYAKNKLGSHSACDTNANFAFDEAFLDCGVDWFILAFDGVDQESYVQYRRRGKLERALQFARDLRDARRRSGVHHPRFAFKMVLFDWNSADHQLWAACRMAVELEADEIRFVNTTTPGGISAGYRQERAREIAELVVEMRKLCSIPINFDHPDCFAGEPHRSHGFLESLEVRDASLSFSGWVLLDDGPADRILLRTPQGVDRLAQRITREDLRDPHPSVPNAELGGFHAELPARDFETQEGHSCEVLLMRGEIERVRFTIETSKRSTRDPGIPQAIRHGRVLGHPNVKRVAT